MDGVIAIDMDSREPEEMQGYLEELGVEVTRTNNKTIDYTHGDTRDGIAFSRKTTTDFADTLYNRDRDLFLEMEKMAYYPRRYLMISGDWRGVFDASTRPIHTMHHVTGAITSLEVRHGVRVLSWADDEMLAYGMYKVCEKAASIGRPTRNVFVRKTRKEGLNKYEQALSVLAAFPGIGETRARNILKEWGSIGNWLSMSGEKSATIVAEVFV